MSGSIEKRTGKNSHSWRVRIDVPTPSGKRKQISHTTNTLKEAQRWKSKKEAEILSGAYIEDSSMTLEEFLMKWLVDYGKSNLKTNTRRNYQFAIEKHIIPEIGDIQLKDISPIQLQSLYTKKLEDLAPSTVKTRIHAILHRALHHAVQWELLNRNPADLVTPPKQDSSGRYGATVIECWDVEQLRDFLKAVDKKTNPLYANFFYTAAMTGMRMGELIGLRPGDVDFKNQVIHVRQNVTRDPYGDFHEGSPKSIDGVRDISIDERLTERLADHLEKTKTLKEHLGDEWGDEKYLFLSTKGTRLNPSNIRRTHNRIIKTAELPKIRFHDLRHTHATLMLASGISPNVVMERLGHADIETTMGNYGHVLPNMQTEAATQFANQVLQEDEIHESSDLS